MCLNRVICTLLAGALGLLPTYKLAAAEPAMGEPAPPLIVTSLSGQTLDLKKLRDKVVLVNFWATWCAPCRKEIPRLSAFYRRYHEQGLEVIGISIDRPDDLEKVRRQMTSIAYPVVVVKDIAVNGLGKPEGVPVTYVIDSKGVVRDKFIEVRNELLNDVVVPLLPRQVRPGANN
jgi:peroxiredoxin